MRNGVDLSGFAGWYSQAGTPELTASRVAIDDDQAFAIEFTQTIPETMAKDTPIAAADTGSPWACWR
jgi:aminopeptidase N